ncbi:DNA topoisomerase IV subunit A [Candidatus Odyssella thessalonicensis]|uniref:DNA topoisomerase IV subunit A n=1 Tax=Candidatus Odyssella thessalonicensis TaxID=84647 RepID=UPI000225C090|nr:DNA topoisomerase IV subunit A [Candidatus Odyssella thessalonicensis]
MTKSAEIINDVPFEKALGDRYLSYALSTIISRSLPDVRDGLKPVHRRLIYAMQQLKLNPNTPFKKSARVVGDVMGKFHPHGDQAIYDALVRLAQDFSVRYPLIDGQGNFGNIDGDNAAAMRYTEARLTELAVMLMEGIEENAIDFRPTYDGEADEPLVFPAAFPNILANGASGIAVGMATSIPPHNLAELCHAMMHMIDHPGCTVAELMRFIPGPDFPTGGILVETPESILRSYETGRGSFRMRARWETEQLKAGSFQIIVTQIPYQVSKSKLIEKIAELLTAKKLPLLDDIRDESADDIRVVLVPKSRNVDPEVLMESLFKATDLEARFSLNMNVLDGGRTPRVMSLKEVLKAFLTHRQEVLVRRSNHRIEHINARLEILEGYLIAYLNIDEVIRIIREEDEPKTYMVEKFGLTDNQVEAILNMRLRALRKLQEIEIRKEHEDLCKEREDLYKLLATESLQWKRIKADIKSIEKKYSLDTVSGKRRTTLEEAPSAIVIPIEAVIEREDVTVVCSQMGWIRCIKGHAVNPDDIKYKEGDSMGTIIQAETTDKILIFATNGKFYTIGVDKLPGGRGHGEPIRMMIELDNTEEMLNLCVIKPDQNKQFLLTSSDSRGFIVNSDDVIAQTRQGKQVMTLGDEGAKALSCMEVTGDMVACIGENRKLLVFPIADVPSLSRGRGVILQKYRQGNLSDIKIFKAEEGLSWIRNGKKVTEKDLLMWKGRRATLGRLAPIGFPRSNKFEA